MRGETFEELIVGNTQSPPGLPTGFDPFKFNGGPVSHFEKGLWISQDLSDDIDGARRPNLIAPAGWRRAEEDAEGVAGWPVT